MFENLNLNSDLLFSYRDFLSIILIIFSSILFIVIFKFTKNYWALTSNMKNIILILPVVSFIITKVIAGNIALSLGMVGALSIVRFRHPVRSALELVIYFCLIALGISYGVSLKWGFTLAIIVNMIIIFNYMKQKFMSSDHENIESGISKLSLEIESKSQVDLLDNSKFLRNSYHNISENRVIYRMEFENKKELDELYKIILNEKNILGISKNI
jgi:ABC-type Fe3+ transport system permease subunit